MHGRGAAENPDNRFDRFHIEPDGPAEATPTHFYRDVSRSILSKNDSPDLGFRYSLNPYRGCEHGCSYCYARPSHEYLGFSAGLDFETRIVVKAEAAELLRDTFYDPGWQPQVVALSGQHRLLSTSRAAALGSRAPVSRSSRSFAPRRRSSRRAPSSFATSRSCASSRATTPSPSMCHSRHYHSSSPAKWNRARRGRSDGCMPLKRWRLPASPWG